MKNKEENDKMYRYLMNRRKENPKMYACTTIAVIYEYLKKRIDERLDFEKGKITSKKFKPISNLEINETKEQIKETVRRMVQLYGLCQKDIDLYNTLSTCKLKITIK